jgi:NADH-quinone oxidoreductase subunit F/NADP-reducing hydrogenase subunit HndC
MSIVRSYEELLSLRDKYKKEFEGSVQSAADFKVVVGMATCGIAAGARETYDAMVDEAQKLGLNNITFVKSGCVGSCFAEPTIEIFVPGQNSVLYGNVDAEKGRELVRTHLKDKNPLTGMMIKKPADDKKQIRIALRNCGTIDPEKIEDYFAVDGYVALGNVLKNMTPEALIDIMKKSGLRGRGGGGFPTGLKWEATRKVSADQKYVICNADEGDPGAFMDRSILEGDPHSVLEAMTLAGYAMGATKGYIYIRAEYPLAVDRLMIAIGQAKQHGLLGKNILGSGFDFSIEIRYGAGAFVCGEETSLIASVEGNRGEPRNKPPFPSESGLWGKPTSVNNVETFANVPAIVLKGAEWFASIGTEKSKGTKVFALAGKVNNVGLIEVPMGVTLREIIYEIGGGIRGGKQFKSVQTGGPSGGCIPVANLDTPIDYETLASIGSMMGSGGMIVMDEDDCMVNLAKFYLEFTVEESCGKCTPCRVGNKRLHGILTKITRGQGEAHDVDDLMELGQIIKDTSLCGLGQTSPNPVLSTIRHFGNEYLAHVKDHKCPAGVCTALFSFFISPEKCVGCTACARACPVNCIAGDPKKLHVIDQDKCIKCGACEKACKKYKAVEKR